MSDLDARLAQIPDAELERLLELRDRQLRNLAAGSALGQAGNRRRSEDHRAVWIREAKRLLTEQPPLWGDLGRVAAKVLEACRDQGEAFEMLNGRAYQLGTVYRHLLNRRKDLLEEKLPDHAQSLDISSSASSATQA